MLQVIKKYPLKSMSKLLILIMNSLTWDLMNKSNKSTGQKPAEMTAYSNLNQWVNFQATKDSRRIWVNK